MWVGVMLAVSQQRKLNAVGALLLVATVITVVQPGWIWRIGFQLSFLGTFGIVVTAPSLQKAFDWLPSRIANALAVPLAATVWTTPILLYQLGYLIPAALPLNILITPVMAILSFGGMVSAGLSLLLPPLGSAAAWGLSYPAGWLILLAQQFQTFPILAVGQIGIWQVLLLYLGLVLIWRSRFWQQRWWFICGAMVLVVLLPIILALQLRTQVNLLDSGKQGVLIAESGGKSVVVRPQSQQVDRTVNSFLIHQGINQVTCEVRYQRSDPLTIPASCSDFQVTTAQPGILALQMGQQRWWFLPKAPYFAASTSSSFPRTAPRCSGLVWDVFSLRLVR